MRKVVKDFRRSQRVIFDMPVDVRVCRDNEDPTFEAAKTLTVNAHGALLALTTPVALGEMLRLINPRTQQEINCHVCRFAMRYPNGVTQVGVEFVVATPTFWDVPSPPPDWDPSWTPPSDRMHLGPALAKEVSGPGTPLDRATAGDAAPNSRQSVRLPLEIPVVFYGHKENMGPSYAEGKTLCVSINGALLSVHEGPDIGQSLLLINSKMGTEIVCYVRSVDRGADGEYYVGVEFATAAPNFWGVDFPSEDRDAAERKGYLQPLPTNGATTKPLFESSSSETEASEVGTQLADVDDQDIILDISATETDSPIPSEAKPDSRRSTRLPFKIPVAVRAQAEDEDTFSAEGNTVQINVNGALLALPAAPRIGQALLLSNSRTGKEIVCHVRSVERNRPGTNHVSVEFEAASPRFWGVNFPPEDWDAAERKLPQQSLPTKAARPKRLLPDSAHPLTKSQEIIAEAQLEQEESLEASESKTKDRGWRAYKWPIIALAACVALFIVWASVHKPSEGGSAALPNPASAGVTPGDADIIPRLEGSRLATAEDFDPDAVSWLHSSGQDASGKIPGAYSGHDNFPAYILITKDNARRVVILADGQTRYDAEYPVIALAARIPKELIPKITWADPSPPESDGDGLLIVRAADAPASGVVLFLRGTRVVSGNPVDYKEIPLGQLP